jgi:hypothetical protein
MDASTTEFTKWLITLGVGGILAAFIFHFYRKDIKQFTELWRTATEQLTAIVKENTASNARLVALLESLERNAIRKSDVEFIIGKKFDNSRTELHPPDRR